MCDGLEGNVVGVLRGIDFYQITKRRSAEEGVSVHLDRGLAMRTNRLLCVKVLALRGPSSPRNPPSRHTPFA